jgi:hypothetical protein
MTELRSDNHFVPKVYLKRWSTDGLRIWAYRTLVSHQNVPLWKLNSLRSIAFHSHLYTRFSANGETDEIERWLDKEFETPAEEALNKAISDKRLSSEDWKKLIRFAAAQHVRTPAQLLKNIHRWNKQIPELVDKTLKDALQELETSKRTGVPLTTKNNVDGSMLPLRISRESSQNPGKALLTVETAIGRSMWLFGIKHILTNTVKVLLEHNWSIVRSAPNFEWVTSDDPVICLNYYGNGSYNFEGGWGKKGCEILMPLSPYHMLYTQVGKKMPSRWDANYELCTLVQRFIAEHSFRWILGKKPYEGIENLRPRIIDPIAYDIEAKTWSKWHTNQSTAEKNLIIRPNVRESQS